MQWICMSKLRAKLLKNWLKLTDDDRCCVLDICFLEKHIRNYISWQEYYRPGSYEHQKISSFVHTLGGNPELVNYCCIFSENWDKIVAEVQSADVLILPGGCPKRGISLITNTPVEAALHNFSGKAIVGWSAGALIQCQKFFLSPNWYYPVQEYGVGLSLFSRNWILEVHYDHSDEMTANIFTAINKLGCDVIALGEDGAIIVRDSGHDSLLGDTRIITKKDVL